MTRLIFITMLPLTILFTMLIGLIQSQPYDDSLLSQLLISPCSTPCFIGIYPGITSGDEAFNLLNNHLWVTNIDFLHQADGTSPDNHDGTITWSWTGGQPPLLRTPYLVAGEILVQNGVVDSIKLRTAIPYAAIWFALGAPPNGWIRPSRAYLAEFDNHVAIYPARGLEIRTLVKHPLRLDAFWNALTDIYFEMNPADNFRYSPPCWWACDS